MKDNMIRRLFGEQITLYFKDGNEDTWILDHLNPVNCNQYVAVISEDFIQILQKTSNENEQGVGVWGNIYLREQLSKINIDNFSEGWDWINDVEELPCLELWDDGTLIIRMFQFNESEHTVGGS